jgi:hypothetical protein
METSCDVKAEFILSNKLRRKVIVFSEYVYLKLNSTTYPLSSKLYISLVISMRIVVWDDLLKREKDVLSVTIPDETFLLCVEIDLILHLTPVRSTYFKG